MLADCIDCEKGKPFLIIGAGGTLREYAEPIKAFIERENPVTIGINKMTGFHIPDYHLWTNKQRWRDFGDCISEKSALMFSAKFPVKLIKQHYKGNYIQVHYTNDLPKVSEASSVDYQDGIIYGDFRTAGTLAIVIAHLFGASAIHIIGMDGYTLHGREAIEGGEQNQHLYGKGFTDNTTWEECLKKDEQVYKIMRDIESFGIKFQILTPTKFEDYYDGAVLADLKREYK